jgi:hypothetical protein
MIGIPFFPWYIMAVLARAGLPCCSEGPCSEDKDNNDDDDDDDEG